MSGNSSIPPVLSPQWAAVESLEGLDESLQSEAQQFDAGPDFQETDAQLPPAEVCDAYLEEGRKVYAAAYDSLASADFDPATMRFDLVSSANWVSRLRVKGHAVTIIGESHDDPAAVALGQYLSEKAVSGKFAVLLEGLPRSDEAEALHAKTNFNSDEKGLLFGIEDSFASYFGGIVSSYLVVDEFLPPEMALRLLHDFMTSLVFCDDARQCWQGLKARGYRSPLFDEIDRFVVENADKKDREFVDAYLSLPHFHDIAEWISIHRETIDRMMETAEASGADVSLVKRVMNPEPDDTVTAADVMDSLAVWREGFMVPNILSVIESLPPGTSVNIIVGNAHRESLAAQLGKMER